MRAAKSPLILGAAVLSLSACSPPADQSPAGETGAAPTVEAPGGIVTGRSAHSVADTMARLEDAVEAKGLTIFARIDHAANAAGAGLDMPPAMVLIFGNPVLGTPLMRTAPSAALDLPQRIAVYQVGEGDVRISYNDPNWLAARHAVAGQDEGIAKISQALSEFAAAAAQ